MNARNGDGFTALHVAAMWGREGSLRQLLSRGADPLIVDNEDMTALECTEGEGQSNTSLIPHPIHYCVILAAALSFSLSQ